MENQIRTARVSAVHRDAITILCDTNETRLDMPHGTSELAVGDHVELAGERYLRTLPRHSLIQRRAAGTDARAQLIAANVDTLGIVTSCNADFNPRRLERYLVLASDANCVPLVIITKSDQAEDAHAYRRAAERLSPLVTALTLDATDAEDSGRLAPWCRDGQTLALVGSSGVGKTTLRNALCHRGGVTQAIRESDARGRHTTTARHLLPTIHGGFLIDTPGMRALRLTDVADGIDEVFADVVDLARHCRFADCAHDSEPGCAVLGAIDDGRLAPARLANWRKLERENAHNSATIAEQRARSRKFSRVAKAAMAEKDRRGRR